MKTINIILVLSVAFLFSCTNKQHEGGTLPVAGDAPQSLPKPSYLFVDVHNLEPGKVTFAAVADAHKKDLATQEKFGVSFIKYWVDETGGKVYCLAESPDSASIYLTHKEAHGLVPERLFRVTDGAAATTVGNSPLFLDIHKLGAGNVTAAAVADVHVKDLAAQDKYHVNFINYWVNEKDGVVLCLSQAPGAADVISTHKLAHGLIPAEVHPVLEGQ